MKFRIEEESFRFEKDPFVQTELINIRQKSVSKKYGNDYSHKLKDFYSFLSHRQTFTYLEEFINSHQMSRVIGIVVNNSIDKIIINSSSYPEFYEKGQSKILFGQLMETPEFEETEWAFLLINSIKFELYNLINREKSRDDYPKLHEFPDGAVKQTIDNQIDKIFYDNFDVLLALKTIIETTAEQILSYKTKRPIQSEVDISSIYTGARVDFMNENNMIELKCKVSNGDAKFIQIISYYLLAANYSLPSQTVKPSIKRFFENVEYSPESTNLIVIDAFFGEIKEIPLSVLNTIGSDLLIYLTTVNKALLSTKYKVEDMNFFNYISK